MENIKITVIKNGKMIRLVCGALMLIGFFLPWLDMGVASVNGFKLALADPRGDPSILFAIPVLGLLVALYPFNNQWFVYVGSILSIGIILTSAPVPIDAYGFRDMNGWPIGKVLTTFSFLAILITAYFSGNKKETKST